jgi:hypothetical protein
MPRLSKIGAAALAAFGWTSATSGGGGPVSASYLIVAGGGGGGTFAGGGGGGGGLLTGTTTLSLASSYTVVVGAGGAGGVGAFNGSAQTNTNSVAGSNSSFGTLPASIGGGAGGNYNAQGGSTGGSGGGGGGTESQSGFAGTSAQGNAGGASSTNRGGGGGGGAGSIGSDYSSYNGGAGGTGLASSINGTSTYYSGGGGGGGYTGSGGSGGSGGGGNGGVSGNNSGYSGTANTGGGGGGMNNTSSGTWSLVGGNGGSGVVIISYPAPQKFGGGTVTTSGGNVIHTFTTSGTLSPINTLSASYLIVAGGGGGGFNYGGGGGAGGLLSGSGTTIDTNSTYLVTVGAGGAGSTTNGSTGVSGSSSTFSVVSTTAVGGGGAGSYSNVNGLSGGSGGGGDVNTLGLGGAGTSGQGYAGANGSGNTSPYTGGGGGGAGAVGSSGNNPNGGVGLTSSISGTSTYYAGGGGGSCYDTFYGGTNGIGGLGGGGNGGLATTAATSGTNNTGGGGGGGANGSASGNGGSGIVIIRYAGSTQQMAGGTVTIVGGNVIHTFTSSGYLTPLTFVGNSLRFRSSNSAYLQKTNVTPTANTKFTFSAWIKRGILGQSISNVFAYQPSSSITDSNTMVIYFNGSDQLCVDAYSFHYMVTNQVFRDPAAWYHIAISFDTTQSVAANRMAMYVNGVQVTSFNSSNAPSQNAVMPLNVSGLTPALGQQGGSITSGRYFDGYMANVQFIDGQALTPNSFGSFNSYGVWQPINYGGSYGTNGFYLPFSNKTSTTTLGYDFSPNGNNWTPNNISLTAGSTYDSMTDVPTLTSATAANYPVINPLDKGTNATVDNGNLRVYSSFGWTVNRASMAYPTTGQYYFEWTYTDNTPAASTGIATAQAASTSAGLGTDAYGWGYQYNGNKYNNNVGTAYGATYTSGDVIGVAFDAGAGTLTYYKNGVSQGVAFTGLTTSTYFPVSAVAAATAAQAPTINFGQQPFKYTPPSGFLALNTFNM